MSSLAIATFVLAFVALISAIFTACMSFYTKNLVAKNEELIEQNERHHIDDERPVMVIESNLNVEHYKNREIISIPKEFENDYSKAIVNNYAKFEVNGILKNIGRGTALNPKMVIRFENRSAKEIKTDFPPLASGSSLSMGIVDFYTSFDSVFLGHDNKFSETEYQTATGQPWEIFIAYQDIYRNTYYTRHSKNPQESWTTIGERGEGIPTGKSKTEIETEFARLANTSNKQIEMS